MTRIIERKIHRLDREHLEQIERLDNEEVLVDDGPDEVPIYEQLRILSVAQRNAQVIGRVAMGEPADGPPGPGGQLLGTVMIRVVREGPFGETIEHNGSDSPLIGESQG